MRNLTYAVACEAIEVIFERAAGDEGLPVCAAVVDAHGDLVAFGRMDGAPVRSVALSRDKAYTAIYMDRDTHEFRDMMNTYGFDVTWFVNDRLTPLPGGVRMKDDEGCIGAIGLSGRLAEEDRALAQIGVDHVAAKLAG